MQGTHLAGALVAERQPANSTNKGFPYESTLYDPRHMSATLYTRTFESCSLPGQLPEAHCTPLDTHSWPLEQVLPTV